VKLLVQPNDGATALLKAIHRAQAHVKIAIFRFDHPTLEEALTTAVKRGVSVHALIAHVNGTGAEALRKLEMRLLAAGVTVARTDTTFLRYHSKYVIIDQRELFVLAYNFTRQDIEKSRSFGLVTKNRRLAQEATKLFEADAKRQTYEVGCSNLIVSPLNARKQLASFIKGAKNELAIYDPRVSDRTILRLLRERADANVSVRIIGWASGRQNTIAVQQLTDIRLHARCIIRDRKAVFIGSQSLRELELDSRRELGMICRARSIVTALRKTFEEDWTRCAQSPIPPDTTRPISKAAKKVAKAIATDLPLIVPALENAAKDVAQNGAKIKWDGGEVEQTVRAAVKEAVKTAVEHVLQETITGEQQSRE
jgi:phosphatidylserine/phosphatidylglycerophosphate/cardiolipin synthase-like enzyme